MLTFCKFQQFGKNFNIFEIYSELELAITEKRQNGGENVFLVVLRRALFAPPMVTPSSNLQNFSNFQNLPKLNKNIQPGTSTLRGAGARASFTRRRCPKTSMSSDIASLD